MKPLAIAIPLCLSAGIACADTLQEAVDATIKTNPDVLAAIHERQAVSKEIDQARAGYFPTLDLAVGTGWEMTDNPSTRVAGKGEVHLNRDEASLNLRQMLFDGMETKNEVARQQARTSSRSFSVYSASENTGLDAVEAYLNVLRRQQLVELAQTNLEAHQRTHDQIMLRSERGVGRRADMDQSLGRLALAEANLMSEQSNLRDAETSYIRVVGMTPESLTQPDSPISLVPETVDESIDIAINNHPTLKLAEFDVESAHAQHATAKAPFYPDVHLELGTRADHDIDGQEGKDKDVTAMLRLRYNLLNGGRDSARREETAYLINQAAEIRNNTRRQVEESVRLSWNAWQTVKNQMAFRRQHVESSEKSRDAYQQQFSLGQRTLLDLLDSENEVFGARTALVNTQYDEMFAMYRILNSMGMLLEGLNVELPEAAATMAANNN
ncbi:TolC family outer membrane protein [Methylophaga sp. OBS4]|uniref:TolC family outer membrane protein n=1 Tax=Methylophaga sp. OBS4 TaxID=2991935 RepID=UPI0022553505|nr:TolC family outer membrane protein [Methylophaga sp. OBS4]MCX4188645.1 TolC family outer membrane protein [Methylophaga sp. OBS4]